MLGVAVAIALIVFIPVMWSWRLVLYYWWHSGPTHLSGGRMPLAAVILPLRGADPSLIPSLRGLLRQRYPTYSVHIVVDDEADPAWSIVQTALGEGRDHVNAPRGAQVAQCPDVRLIW
jgi:hypothetical protein